MAEVNSSAAFPAKRKPDPSPPFEEDEPIDKHRKLESTSDQTLQIQKPNPPAEIESQRPRIELPKLETGDDGGVGGRGGAEHSNGNSSEDEEVKKVPLGIEEDKVGLSEPPEPEISGDSNAENDGPADRKGKGISIQDKGKGKLMEEEESDEDDSSSDDDDDDDDVISLSGSDSGGDPLEEVDPSNILPSRTRRRVPQPGFYFNSNIPAGDECDDSSDDSDA